MLRKDSRHGHVWRACVERNGGSRVVGWSLNRRISSFSIRRGVLLIVIELEYELNDSKKTEI